MQRRIFFKWLAGSIGLAVTAGPASLLLQPKTTPSVPVEAATQLPALAPEPVAPAVIEPDAEPTARLKGVGIPAMTLYVAQRVRELLGRDLVSADLDRTGQNFGCEYSVSAMEYRLRPPHEWHFSRDRAEVFCNQVARALSHALKDKTSTSVLPFPSGVEECSVITGHGIAIRGMKVYDMQADAYRYRFDTLCG